VGVDRFFELFHTRLLKVSVPDLIVLATAKYPLEFFDLPKERLYIVVHHRGSMPRLRGAWHPAHGSDPLKSGATRQNGPGKAATRASFHRFSARVRPNHSAVAVRRPSSGVAAAGLCSVDRSVDFRVQALQSSK
jgi:hypothetical protein